MPKVKVERGKDRMQGVPLLQEQGAGRGGEHAHYHQAVALDLDQGVPTGVEDCGPQN